MRCRVRRKCGVGIDGCQDWVGEVLLNSAATVDPLWELACRAAASQRWLFIGVHIHSCGNGHLWFRSYSDSLFQTPKSKQKALPQHPAPSPRLGVPSLRHPSAGHRLRLASLHLLSMTAATPQRATRSPRMNASTQPSVTGPVNQDHQQPRRPTGRPMQESRRSSKTCGSQPAGDGRLR